MRTLFSKIWCIIFISSENYYCKIPNQISIADIEPKFMQKNNSNLFANQNEILTVPMDYGVPSLPRIPTIQTNSISN